MNEELRVIITAEISRLRQGMEDARSQVRSFRDNVRDASSNVDSNFQRIGSATSKAMKTVATAIAGGVAALLALGASTTEYRENQAKLTTAFETAGASAGTAKGVYNDLYRVMGESDTAVEAANHLAKLTTNEKELSQWTNICQGIYATFGDSLPIEGLTESANETAKVGKVTGTLADALNWAGISEDEFNEKLAACTSESEREKLIRETLNSTYKEAASNYEKNNKKIIAQNEAQAKLQETTAKLGDAVQPVITAFTNFASNALAVVTPYIQSLADQYMPLLQFALEATSNALSTAMSVLSEHWGIIVGIAAVIAGITAAIGLYNIVAAIKAAMDAAQVTTLAGLAAAYLAQAAAMAIAIAPYVLIVAAIAAVIAIIVVCIKHWDQIKAKVKEVWEKIKKYTTEAVTKVVQKFTELKDKAIEKVNSLKDSAVNKFNEIKTGVVEKVQATKQAVVNKYNEIKSGITEKISGAKTAVVNGFQNMKTAAVEKISSMASSVKSKFDNIKKAITEKINSAKDAVKTGIDKMKSFFNFKWSLPKLKMPHISVSGKFSLNPPSAPKFSISWHKLGGVFDSPTLFNYGGSMHGLGEDGAEAIVPLEKNTKWLDRLATMLSEKQGKTPIIMQVDGKTFAQISVDSINDLTRQTGNLQLKLM